MKPFCPTMQNGSEPGKVISVALCKYKSLTLPLNDRLPQQKLSVAPNCAILTSNGNRVVLNINTTQFHF